LGGVKDGGRLSLVGRWRKLPSVEWMLGLSSWIIQDGNYGDVRRDEPLEAAVEFRFADAPTLVEVARPFARHVGESTYEVTARVVLVEPDVWAIDIGICVFNEHKPPIDLTVGDVVSGRAYLGIDPFFYFERLGKRASMLPLIYTWNVVGIVRQTAPLVQAGPRLLVRDASKLGWEAIEQTNAWSDGSGRAPGCGSRRRCGRERSRRR
jgi:hypothetical protein